MRIIPNLCALAILLTAIAAPAATVGDRPESLPVKTTLADRLFPETAIEGEGWRDLLPIMLFNFHLDAQRPVQRTERGEAGTR